MQSAQESKQELEAAIRYAENAISSANKTIESMEFRQEMAKKQSSEQTGREETLTKQVQELEERNDGLNAQVVDLNVELQRQQGLGQGYYDNMMTFKEEREMLEKNVKYLRDENERLKRDVEFYTKEYNGLMKQKEASSGPCGCQAYRDLEEARGRAEGEVELLQRTISDLEAQVNAFEQPERATMPVIPKAVAIAIFREGVAHGVSNACDEIDNSADICIEENEYCGGFEVSFNKDIDLSEHIDLDWMRDKVGDYDEASVIDALKNLCVDKEFECRIHGIDDQEEKKND